jgi:hypothetical protein
MDDPYIVPRRAALIHGTQRRHPQRLVQEMTTLGFPGYLARIDAGLFRRWLGLERLHLRFTQLKKRGRSHRLRPHFFIAPARCPYQPTLRLRVAQALRLSPPCPRTAGEQQGNFAQHKSLRHHPGSLVQYTD